MPICGYNEQMGDGLRELFTGIHKILRDKARKENIDFPFILYREVQEIPEINGHLEKAESVYLQMFLGLNYMVLPFFQHLRNLCKQGEVTEEIYFQEVENFLSDLRKAEQRNLALAYESSDQEYLKNRAGGLGAWIVDKLDT